ncbi:MAG: hypothetical protein ACK55Z_05985, partial [bacterium]
IRGGGTRRYRSCPGCHCRALSGRQSGPAADSGRGLSRASQTIDGRPCRQGGEIFMSLDQHVGWGSRPDRRQGDLISRAAFLTRKPSAGATLRRSKSLPVAQGGPEY